MTQDNDDPIGGAARRLFDDLFEADAMAGSSEASASQWAQCVEGGFVHALLPESQGGIDLGLPDYFTTALAAGACAAPLPVVHTALFLRLLAQAAPERALPDGAITYAERVVIAEGALRASDVPWAAVSPWMLADTPHGVWLLPVKVQGQAQQVACQGEGPDAWSACGGCAVPISSELLRSVAAAGYSALLAGALERMLALTLQHANERKQFGKPIGRFQAIQQQISAMAERVIAARMAAQMGFNDDVLAGRQDALAVAKAITSEVVPMAASVAHAVHGAIGVTAEFSLQRYSGAAHRWRGAAGGEVYWRRLLGKRVLADRTLPRDFLRTHLSGAFAEDAR